MSTNARTAELKVYHIDLPAQSVAESLADLSEQIDVLLLFPYNVARKLKANPVKGKYTLPQALEIMLEGTGFSGGLSEKGVLMISFTESEHANKKREAEDRSEMKSKKNILAAMIGFIFGVDGVQGAVAQGEHEKNLDRSFPELEEIIVTATRREASMQDIPMSINAFSGDQLKQSGIEDVRDLPSLISGLHVMNVAGTTKITLRGIGANQDAPGGESGVAMHRDGIYLEQRQDLSMGFFDVERIEVLRGPQGTLYGRNATGGAINIVNKAPTSTFEGGGSVTLGNYDLIEVEGNVSGPLVEDTLLARIAFKTRKHDGYTPSLFDGVDRDDADFAGVRTKMDYRSEAGFRLDLTMDYSRDNSVPAFVVSRGREGTPLVVETMGSILPSGRAVNQDRGGINQQEVWGITGRVEWNFGGVTMTSLTGYRELEWFRNTDLDGGDQEVFSAKSADLNSSQVSQELTLASSEDQDLQWVGGIFYFHSDLSDYQEIPLPSREITYISNISELKTDAYAIFGEANYHIFNALTLTLGARYSYEEKSIKHLAGGIDAPASEQLDDSWSSFTPKVALTYEWSENISTYATFGSGFKAGGYNGGNLQGKAFEPEKVINYEVGLKSSFYDDCLRLNIAAFYMDYKDLQVLVLRTNPLTNNVGSVIDNAATAKIQGIEFDFQVQPTESLSFDGNISYLDATFDDWGDAVDALRGNEEFDVGGNQLLNAPEWAGNLGAIYTVPIGGWGSVSLRGEYAYKSEVFYTPFDDDLRAQDGFGLANARLTFEDAGGRWSFAGWVKNINDKEVTTFKNEIASGLTGNRTIRTFLPPRTYGVKVGYRF